MAQVDIRGVSKRYGTFSAVEDANIVIPEGSFFSLLGPSGSGKTTLLRLVAGFVRSDCGTIRIGSRIVNDVPPHKRDIGMVFQSYALFPHRTIIQNISFGLEMRGVKRAEALQRAMEALELVQLADKSNAYPKELSGGQQQRIAIARAIVIRPSVLLLDEPLSALDQKLRADMQIELRSLQKKLGITALYVTHDQEEALALSDHIAILNKGHIAQQGSARALYERPDSAFVANFLGNANLLDATVSRRGDRLFAQVGGQILPYESTHSFQEGQSISLAIRPDKIDIRTLHGATEYPYEEGVGLTAELLHFVYLGNDVRAQLRLPTGQLINARFRAQSKEALIKEGSMVRLTWQAKEAIGVAN